MGRGYYSYEHFRHAPEVRTDASKSGKFADGGYVSRCGRYDLFSYGRHAAHKPIDFLEGDV
eukprot:1334927-Prymnesium_polylepis.1